MLRTEFIHEERIFEKTMKTIKLNYGGINEI